MLPWPLPALLTWAFAWTVFALMSAVAAPPIVALACAAVVGALPAVLSPWPLTRWRRLFIALGFPLSLALSGSAHDVPAWAWLLPLTVLALLYPLNAWRDAPFFPTARIDGIEWSWPLRWACQWRCRFAGVTRGDLWKTDWSAFQLVYLFQRPESMPRAVEKACRELPSGSWLASLEFEARQLQPDAVHACPDGRTVWLYQQPFTRRRESSKS